jgi:tripartite-type tricarboxylate transporter receptor subunit TctC
MRSAGSRAVGRAALTLRAAFVAAMWAWPAHAEDFYKDKQVRLIAGFPAGNDYDLGARLLVKYLPKYLPGQPTSIVQNMPQAASVAAANYLYAQAPRDGTVLGSFSRNIVNDALTGQPNVTLDPRRFIWLGATSRPARVCVRSVGAPVHTPADLFTTEFIVGAAGAASSLAIVPTVLNKVLGTKFRIVEGYQGMGDAMLAVQRGETQGVCASYGQFRIAEQQIRDGKLLFLLRAEEAPIPEIPDVPSIFDFAKTGTQRQLMNFVFSSTVFGRPYVFPPDVPQARVDAMRQAIAAAVHDPLLLAEAASLKMDMSFTPPEQLATLLATLYQTPPDVIATVKDLLPNEK